MGIIFSIAVCYIVVVVTWSILWTHKRIDSLSLRLRDLQSSHDNLKHYHDCAVLRIIDLERKVYHD